MSIKSCVGDPTSGAQLHGLSVSSGLLSFSNVSNSLINMYSKSALPRPARALFEEMRAPDTVSWNTLLSAFPDEDSALEFASRMHRRGVPFDAVTFTAALSASSRPNALHSLATKCGVVGSNAFVGNALISMYARCGDLEAAVRAFDGMTARDSVSWNALISALAREGDRGCQAMRVFVRMTREASVRLNHVAFVSAISACGEEGCLEFGRQLHGLATKTGVVASRDAVSNTLMSMYSKCGSAELALKVFDEAKERNVVSWTTAISINGMNPVSLFNGMRLDGIEPNEVTFVALLSMLSAAAEVKMIHGTCLKTGFFPGNVNVSNSLISTYARFDAVMEDSRQVFDEMRDDDREIVSWNALVSGYAQNGMHEKALETYSSLLLHSVPTSSTLGSVLGAIAAAEAISLARGRQCHARAVKSGLESHPVVSGALVDMYSKRGSIGESRKVFDGASERTLVAWTSIIAAHARHGDYGPVTGLFREMVQSGLRPDPVTFLVALIACGRSGVVDEGRRILESMERDHGIKPEREHYACVVDMLGRAGRLDEAEELIRGMPMRPGRSALQSLLGACRIHGEVEMGRRAAEALMKMEPKESGAYVLMSNMYAEKGEWEKVAGIRRRMRDWAVKKEVGFSWVDVGGGGMHGFSSEDKSHPQTEEVYRVAENLGWMMRMIECNSEVFLDLEQAK
ncbi:Pentatricopeptide repeat-containing protein [Acorus calamus]|uniref:Pentatricopeptide repeat-containing protein n=1 Tax=Acorus calamus TaxID=4465 RepID=A0AAV9E2L2_ACOCL|nr:Pentatricopeptide repeat-containing protein [Acorus calamus]